MAEHSDRSPWAPPDDEVTWPPSDDGGSGAVPPPPPPFAPPPPPAPPLGMPPYSHPAGPGWQPPPTSTSRTGLVLGIVAGAVILFGLAVAGLLIVLAESGAPEAQEGPIQELPGPDPGPPADAIPADDVVAQTQAILETIDASELRMISFGQDMAANLDEDGSLGSGAEAISRAAVSAGDDLTTLRSELRALAGGEGQRFDGLRDVRDAYARHMQAWIDYADAVAGSPALAVADSTDADAFWQDINDTGDDFVDAVEDRLPQDIPVELRQFAEFIVERGFGGAPPSGGDLV